MMLSYVASTVKKVEEIDSTLFNLDEMMKIKRMHV